MTSQALCEAFPVHVIMQCCCSGYKGESSECEMQCRQKRANVLVVSTKNQESKSGLGSTQQTTACLGGR